MRMPDSRSKHTFPPVGTLQRYGFGSVGTVVDGGMVVVVRGETVVVVDFEVDVLTLTTMLESLCNLFE